MAPNLADVRDEMDVNLPDREDIDTEQKIINEGNLARSSNNPQCELTTLF
jgi:hypothetical protein